jgi:hypothetical protein
MAQAQADGVALEQSDVENIVAKATQVQPGAVVELLKVVCTVGEL